MKYRKLGSHNVDVSALGFGAMRLPTKRNSMLSRVKEQETIRLIRYAINKGINYFDTAIVYHLGASERILGKALRNGYREKIILVNKAPIYFIRKEEDFDKYLERQLKKMETDYFDIYLFHGLNRKNFEKVKKLNLIEKMKEAKEKGLLKYIGFSFHDTLPVFKEIVDYFDWDVIQIQYNYMDTAIQATTDGLKYAHEKGMAVIIMEPLKGGQLVNPPKEALDIMNSAKSKRTPVDWALQYLWNLPEVSVVLSGMNAIKQIDENCSSADESGINSLGKEDLEVLNKVAEIYRRQILIPCTACQYCMPCQFGVNIPENFALLNNFNIERSRRRLFSVKRNYKRLTKSPYKVDADKPNGNASLCTRCMECIEKCPQEILIPDELNKVHAILGEKKSISDFY